MTIEINSLVIPVGREVDREKRILRVTECPGGQPKGYRDGGIIDIVIYYDYKLPSAQPDYYAPTSDERDRKLFDRYRSR